MGRVGRVNGNNKWDGMREERVKKGKKRKETKKWKKETTIIYDPPAIKGGWSDTPPKSPRSKPLLFWITVCICVWSSVCLQSSNAQSQCESNECEARPLSVSSLPCALMLLFCDDGPRKNLNFNQDFCMARLRKETPKWGR